MQIGSLPARVARHQLRGEEWTAFASRSLAIGGAGFVSGEPLARVPPLARLAATRRGESGKPEAKQRQ